MSVLDITGVEDSLAIEFFYNTEVNGKTTTHKHLLPFFKTDNGRYALSETEGGLADLQYLLNKATSQGKTVHESRIVELKYGPEINGNRHTVKLTFTKNNKGHNVLEITDEMLNDLVDLFNEKNNLQGEAQ
jgi:hypothetical protein